MVEGAYGGIMRRTSLEKRKDNNGACVCVRGPSEVDVFDRPLTMF